jgi:3-oxoacyl-[acyl-carrier protein] reductase
MKTAVITGASRGVGRAAAEALAREGWRLILNCRSHFDALDQVAAALARQTEVAAIHGPIDEAVLSKHLGIDLNAFASVCEEELESSDSVHATQKTDHGCDTGVSICGEPVQEHANVSDPFARRTRIAEDSADQLLLINNGGISTFHLAQEVTDAELEEMLDANLKTMFRTTRAMIPYLLKVGKGAVINISSVWGQDGASMESVYSMTKGGINAFTRALGKELAPNHIPVNALALGCVDTDMNAWLSPEDREALESEIPYGRMATPEEAAEMIVLLAKAPAYLTGQIITMDGGWI